ncbi:MAG: cellulose biosynthesis protein BcsS [Acidobacteria bacterium]|nr:cellulose biosynthesis protein BcsS [Acidobacteriota bacterium]
MKNCGRILGVWFLLVLLRPPGASAQEIVGGWEGDATRGYAFGMPVFSIGLTERNFLVLRGSGSHLYYTLPEVGGETEVSSPGANAGLAYRLRTPQVTFTLGPGYEMRWTRRRLADSSQVRETERGFNLQGDIFFQATPLTNLNAIVSYGEANEYLWSRAGIKRQVTNTEFQGPASLIFGMEGTAQGNDDIRVYQAGGLFEVAFPRARASLQFRGGYSQEQFPNGQINRRPYYGAGLYWAF